MAEHLDRGTFGEQGAGFCFGSQGYFLVEGPSGTQQSGHAANAPGFDGVAYNPKTDHLIIYDNKTFRSDRNVNCGMAIDPKLNLGKNIGALISRVEGIPDLPRRSRILDLLRRTQSTVACGGVSPPPNVQIAITNFGGNSTGITSSLSNRGLIFIDMNRAPAIPALASRFYVSRGTIPTMAKPSSNGTARYNLRRGRVEAAVAVATFVAQGLNDLALQHSIKRTLAGLTPQIGEALISEGGALAVVNVDAVTPPAIIGATTARSVRSAYIVTGTTEHEAVVRWDAQPRWEAAPGPHVKREVHLFWFERPR